MQNEENDSQEGLLTIEMLDNYPCDLIFRWGDFIDSRYDIPIWFPPTNRLVLWAAVKGKRQEKDGISDWCIYTSNPEYEGSALAFRDFGDVKYRGHKIHEAHYIRKLVPCTHEVMTRYRH